MKIDANTNLTGVTSVGSAATYNTLTSCAVANGNVWCWGRVSDITNNGTTLDSPYAVQVTTNGTTPLSGVLAVAISYGHACALVQNGNTNEVWCWGDNQYGEAGTGLQTRVRYPTKVLGFTGSPTAVRLTAETSYALEGDRVKCWGRNLYNECGTTDNASPHFTPVYVKVQGGTQLTGATALSSISSEACVLRTDQTVWCWGYSGYQNYAAPLLVSSTPVTGATAIGGLNRFYTSDGKYHINTVSRTVNCNPPYG